ncbi:UDP-N-acetylmuramoyl-L-alanyl-D-glutamate--2,6-diaminopimelate ligase [Aneurinibacillus thermoaerophilus]|uniref:UDP-N-acetylmuramoyl-L-alanyl-D-glutamate--2,6-diaminopimelate ligase n=1 Tax=Aneurinibacillus thermoaerophilus TaxID=143495 RepID=A0A1G7W888_ANETH|nr:UDP-N-acetylmuramoyl-L-alanyl-D-glutamate--2,6-diaminopimelate ligase [Aneurinibacillus thermoaerophilus]MED0674726.1 UDP-N-acetylmuramoyl-L-alanyl-D-glutamate--2,6-diaminopimelate ligase [Aneurinibacillus thermoaerophilus]MED0680209.1 UDP-N-acetylmuramoyl-L-alanyl-D-glutamate--2,6-diaminopimelate ligase [Aneurinibacillus thermoaerophilus]MED0736842.1 UDP-N-acetylmuramoyl-L-alanyl-D-glutamate--2,6-diaminopimelate ligase [Aneurinibacillus thermoaerophilus]MED0756683.1 UDP-N-acetylmuramoyl-L-a
MQLEQLLAPLALWRATGNVKTNITGIEVDSRKVKPGDLFICLPGFTVDGHDFAVKAVERGAVAVLAQREVSVHVPVVYVPDTKRAMAVLADRFFGHPTQHMKIIGVTGTNGKTTTTYLIERILGEAGHPTGIIGTIEMRLGDEVREVKNTTPEALDLQRAFRWMKDKGAEYAAIEVSSHALDMGRVRGVRFATGVFTNLTQDHLDYHKTMENYLQAKGLLFSQLGNEYDNERMKYAVLNADDPASETFARITPAQIITYGIRNAADVRARDILITANGTRLTIDTFVGSMTLTLRMIGNFNIYNALAATAACLVEGIPLEQIKATLEKVEGVRGRFERVDAGQDFTVIVDYAHTPDSLENVLKTIREFAEGKVYCIVGCGGDRDRTKRPIMASIAARYADVAVITSDNPRSEDPKAIIDEMVAGLIADGVSEERYFTRVDRREAIREAIHRAAPSDVVLIAGKGHETYQILKDKTIHFDDKEEAYQAILEKKK